MTKALAAFDAALGDDLNTPEALSAVHVLVGEVERCSQRGDDARGCGPGAGRDREDGLGPRRLLPQGGDRLSAEEQALFDERQEARRKREFARADERAAQAGGALGIILEDSARGTRWRRKR